MRILIVILILICSYQVAAQGEKAQDKKAQSSILKNEKIIFKVKGMVCAFCAQGIEKNFNKKKEVKSTKVNLDNMEVTLILNPGKKLTDKKIKKIVKSAGFAFDGFKK